MEQNSSFTEFGKISKDAIPVAVVLANKCVPEGMPGQIFALIHSILRGETPDLGGLPVEVTETIPRLRALDRRSLEMVGGFFGHVGVDGDPNNDPMFVAMGILMTGRSSNVVTVAELRRLIDTFKNPKAPIPADLSPYGAEAAQVMQLLSAEFILDMESWFFGEDPATANQDSAGDE